MLANQGMKKIACAFLASLVSVLLLSAPSLAQNQHEMNQQAAADFQKADKELNTVYKLLMKKLSGKVKQRLIDSQILWVKFRDAEADAHGLNFEGGTMQPMIFEGTRARLTEKRVSELKEWLKEFDNR